MGRIVSNATPLIYLAKIERLDLLRKIYREVFIPKEVEVEVVKKGKEMKKRDAFLVEKAIQEGWLKVLDAKIVRIPIELESGEMAAISLAKNLKINEILMDERSGRAAAELVDLLPRGTIFVLLKALENKDITLDDFLEILAELIGQGFRLNEEVYIEVVRKAREIVGER